MDKSNFNKQNLKKSPKGFPPRNNAKPDGNGSWLFWVAMGFMFLIFLSQSNTVTTLTTPKILSYSEFYSLLISNNETGTATINRCFAAFKFSNAPP